MKTFFAAVLLCVPIMAQASDPVPGQPADKEKKACRSEEVTGSLFPKRVCHTKAEWAALDLERQHAAEEVRNRSRGNGSDIPN